MKVETQQKERRPIVDYNAIPWIPIQAGWKSHKIDGLTLYFGMNTSRGNQITAEAMTNLSPVDFALVRALQEHPIYRSDPQRLLLANRGFL